MYMCVLYIHSTCYEEIFLFFFNEFIPFYKS